MSSKTEENKRPSFAEGDIVHEYYETYDLDKFDIMEGQREVKPSSVKSLFNSILNKGYTLSIGLVDEKKRVLDGQTRLAALKMLRDKKDIRYPFYYAVSKDATIDTCALLNSNTKNWGLTNYIHAGTKSDRPTRNNYIQLENLCKDYKKITDRLIASICLNIRFQHARVDKIVMDYEFEFKIPLEEVRKKLDLIMEFMDCRDKLPNDMEVVSHVLIFIIDVLKKDKDVLHARIEKEIKNRSSYESKRPKAVLEVLENAFYSGNKKSKQETLSWSSLYEIYYQNEDINDIKNYIKKTSDKPVKKKAPEPKPMIQEVVKENVQEVIAKASSKKAVAKKAAAPVKEKRSEEPAPESSDEPALSAGKYIDTRTLLFGNRPKKPKK